MSISPELLQAGSRSRTRKTERTSCNAFAIVGCPPAPHVTPSLASPPFVVPSARSSVLLFVQHWSLSLKPRAFARMESAEHGVASCQRFDPLQTEVSAFWGRSVDSSVHRPTLVSLLEAASRKKGLVGLQVGLSSVWMSQRLQSGRVNWQRWEHYREALFCWTCCRACAVPRIMMFRPYVNMLSSPGDRGRWWGCCLARNATCFTSRRDETVVIKNT